MFDRPKDITGYSILKVSISDTRNGLSFINFSDSHPIIDTI